MLVLLVQIVYNCFMPQKYCHFNGKITTPDKVKINPYDLGFLRGHGVFDVMSTVNGKPFLLDEHWKRFQNSAKMLGLKIPVSGGEYEKIVRKLLKSNGLKKSTIRTILTGGISLNGSTYCQNETFIIFIEKFHGLSEEVYAKGARVVTHDHERHIPTAKVCNYAEAIRHQGKKEKAGALEIIYVKNGKALEASTSNFFIVKNGKLITVKEGILIGTTRNSVIRLARKAGYKIEERDIKIKELHSADEVFLTATNKDVVPVIKIDGKKVGDGKVGKNTKVLMELFRKFTLEY